METLEHNGAIFTKATVLAKRLNYTTDYIGQLCRAGKVEAKLVGRAWFVREDTLTNHKADRYKSVRPAEILSKSNAFTYEVPVHTTEKVQVFPRVSKHLHRSHDYQSTIAPVNTAVDTSVNSTAITSRYDEDTHVLHPDFHYLKQVTEVEEPEEEAVEAPLSAQKISIRNETARPKKLYFEPLAEVSLSGSLKIQNLDAEGSYAPSAPVTPEEVAAAAPKQITPRIPVPVAKITPPVHSETQPRPVVARVSRPVSFSPTSVTPVVADRGIPFFVPVVFVVSITATVLMLSLSSYVESDGVFFNQSLRFSVAQAISALSAFNTF
jgi:hypothetical protein